MRSLSVIVVFFTLIPAGAETSRGLLCLQPKKENRNISGLIFQSVDENIITDIATDYLSLIETSTAIYERNSDYALGLFSSGWCRFLNNYTFELAKVGSYSKLVGLIVGQLEEITNAVFITFSEYDSNKRILRIKKVQSEQSIIDRAIKLVGQGLLNIEIPVNDDLYSEMTSSVVGFPSSLTEVTQGIIPEKISSTIQ